MPAMFKKMQGEGGDRFGPDPQKRAWPQVAKSAYFAGAAGHFGDSGPFSVTVLDGPPKTKKCLLYRRLRPLLGFWAVLCHRS